MTLPTEREFDLEEAECRIDAFFFASKVSCEIESHGDQFGVCLARLYDESGLISAGAGKGDIASARIGAKYEVAEHWLTQQWGVSKATVEPVAKLLARAGADVHPLNLLDDQRQAQIACRHFFDLRDGSSFAYPMALFLPDYDRAPLEGDNVDYRSLRRYASNSGTAIGGSVDEATLHALNECIERDAVSLFLLKHFYYRSADPILRIDASSLSGHTRDLHDHLLSNFHDVVLLDIFNGCGVTTCLAFFRTSYDGPHIYGAGASLNPSHAAYRAMAELLQLHCVTELGLCIRDTRLAQNALKAFPSLYRSLMFDIESLLRKQTLVQNCQDRTLDPTLGSVREQVSLIAGALHAQGVRSGACVLGVDESGPALVSVTVPSFERFFIVASGHVVLPGPRGRGATMAVA